MSLDTSLLPEAEVTDGVLFRVKVTAGALNAALQEVSHFVPKNPAQSILSSVRIASVSTATGQILTVTASDSTLSRTVSVPVKTEGAQHVFPSSRVACVPFQTLHQMVRIENALGMSTEIVVTLKAKKNQVTATLKADSSTYEIPCVDTLRAAKFPYSAPAGTWDPIKLSVGAMAELTGALHTVVSATSADDYRPGLQQVLLRHDPTLDALVAVACDGVRYEQVRVEVSPELTKVLDKVTLPVRMVKELNRITEEDVEARLGILANSFVLVFRRVSENPENESVPLGVMTSQRLAAPFPDLADILLKPTFSYDYSFAVPVVGKDGLIYALKRTLSNPDDSGTVSLTLNPAGSDTAANGTLTVEGSGGIGAGTVTVDVPLSSPWTSPARSVSFSTQALAAALRDVSRVPGVVRFRLGKELKTKPSALLVEVHPDTASIPNGTHVTPGPILSVVVAQSKSF